MGFVGYAVALLTLAVHAAELRLLRLHFRRREGTAHRFHRLPLTIWRNLATLWPVSGKKEDCDVKPIKRSECRLNVRVWLPR